MGSLREREDEGRDGRFNGVSEVLCNCRTFVFYP